MNELFEKRITLGRNRNAVQLFKCVSLFKDSKCCKCTDASIQVDKLLEMHPRVKKKILSEEMRKLTIQFLFFTFFILLVLYIPQGNISRSWWGWNYILTASHILSLTRAKSFSLCWHNSGICNLRGLHKLFVQEIVC